MENTDFEELDPVEVKRDALKIFSIGAFILTILFIFLAIFNYGKMNDQNLDYKKVEATVKTATYERVYAGKMYNFIPKVEVIYDGVGYELINPTDAEMHKYQAALKTGGRVTVYLSGRKLYSNVNGIKTNSKNGENYFIVLALAVISGIATIIFIACYKDYNKKNPLNELDSEDSEKK